MQIYKSSLSVIKLWYIENKAEPFGFSRLKISKTFLKGYIYKISLQIFFLWGVTKFIYVLFYKTMIKITLKTKYYYMYTIL